MEPSEMKQQMEEGALEGEIAWGEERGGTRTCSRRDADDIVRKEFADTVEEWRGRRRGRKGWTKSRY